jgi:hypothetical protein
MGYRSSWREISQRLDSAGRDPDGLYSHAIFATALEEVRPHGLLPLVEGRLKDASSLEPLADQFEAVAVRQLARAVYASAGSELSRYRGSKLDELRAALAEKDREINREAAPTKPSAMVCNSLSDGRKLRGCRERGPS